eukprot:scaffold43813_cov55-Phaeocystis_antarctica.AAC.5
MRVLSWCRAFINFLEASGMHDPSSVMHVRAVQVRANSHVDRAGPDPLSSPSGPAAADHPSRRRPARTCVEPAPRQEHPLQAKVGRGAAAPHGRQAPSRRAVDARVRPGGI